MWARSLVFWSSNFLLNSTLHKRPWFQTATENEQNVVWVISRWTMKIHESPQALTCQCMCSDHHGLQKTNSTVKQVSSSQPKHLLPISPNAKPQIPTDQLKHHTPVYRYPFAKFSQIWQPLPHYLYSETLILFLLAGPLKTKIPTAPSSCRILENPNYQLSCTIAKSKILRFAYKDLKDQNSADLVLK